MFALVDAEDYERVSRHLWSPSKGTRNRKYYAKSGPLYMHRLILGIKDRRIRVDHRSGDTLDNRKANLRIATTVQNVANRAAQDSESGYKGVYPARSRWRARIGDGGCTHLGTFDTPEQAALAYDRAARKRWGEFACVNFPLPGERSCRVHDKSEKRAGTTKPRQVVGTYAVQGQPHGESIVGDIK